MLAKTKKGSYFCGLQPVRITTQNVRSTAVETIRVSGTGLAAERQRSQDEVDEVLAGLDIIEDSLPGVLELSINPGRGNKPIRTDANLEPVFFHAWPRELYTEILHSFCLRGILDLTAGSGQAAIATIREKKIYVGVCLSSVHKEMLQEWLTVLVWRELLDPESPLHNSQITALMKKKDDRPVPKAKSKAKSKSKRKKEIQNKEEKEEEENDESDGESDEGDDE